MVRITALMDNEPGENPQLLAEHGLSFYIEYNDLRLLFDCGQSGGFLHNAGLLGLHPEKCHAIVLSHSHYDHALGFRELCRRKPTGTLFTGPGFWEPKFAWKDGNYRDLSCGFDRDFLNHNNIDQRTVDGTEEIFPGVWLITGFPRVHPFETIPERFVKQTPQGLVADDFGDEVCLALENGDSLTLIVGCSHPGILNITTHVVNTLGKPVRALFGGTHLVEAEPARILATLEGLTHMGVQTIGMSHCSGQTAEEMIRKANIRGCHLKAGDSITLT